VHHNKEVTLKIQVEVSQISGSVATGGGQSQPIIGTRQIQTVIRLRDGETNMLAGLIQRQLTDARGGVPGLLDVPGLRRVLGTTNYSNQETDIIMTITPRIVRVPDITEDDLATLWVGTEDNMRLRGTARNALNQSPFLGGTTVDGLASGAPRRPGGSLTRMAPSEEVQRDREAASRELPLAEGAPGAGPGGRTQGRRIGQAGGGAAVIGGAEQPREPEVVEPEPEVEPQLEPEAEPPLEEQEPEAEPERRSQGSGDEDDDGREQPAGPALVRLIPSKATYSVGETVDLQVFVQNGSNIGSVPFHLRYNPQVLQYVPPAIKGPFLEMDGVEAMVLANEASGGGEVVVGASRLGGGQGVSGSGVLATFRFLAVGPGDAGFVFTGASVKDSQARNLPASFTVVAVRVE
jgi:general secretion pathway protein D